MKEFSFKRMGAVIKWSLTSEKRNHIRFFIAMFVAFMLVFAAATKLFMGYSDVFGDTGYYIAAVCSSGIAGFAFYFCASRAFGAFKTKQTRTQFLMLPASNNEKFWARIVVALIRGIGLSVLALVAADLVQYALTALLSGHSVSVVRMLYNIATFNFDAMPLLVDVEVEIQKYHVITSVLQSMMYFSIFLFGGVFFRRHPFLQTTGFYFLFLIVFTIVITSIAMANPEGFLSFIVDSESGLSSKFTWVTISVYLIVTVLALYFSHRIFSRMQVINDKWLNL